MRNTAGVISGTLYLSPGTVPGMEPARDKRNGPESGAFLLSSDCRYTVVAFGCAVRMNVLQRD